MDTKITALVVMVLANIGMWLTLDTPAFFVMAGIWFVASLVALAHAI